MPDYRLYLRGSDRLRLGEVDAFTAFQAVMRFNQPASWILDLNAADAAAAWAQIGNGLVLTLDGQVLLSGPIRQVQRSVRGGQDVLEVSGFDDLVFLQERLAYPVTGGPPYTASAYNVRTGPVERILKEYVDANAANAATVARRVPGLTLAPVRNEGQTVTGRARFHNLLGLIQRLALAGGDVGFRVRQAGTNLEFDVYQPADRRATARFSLELGNLLTYELREAAARANYILVGGDGVGTARTIVEKADSNSVVRFGRMEVFRDARDTSDTGVMGQRADETLLEQRAITTLRAEMIDTPTLRFGVDYGLGDRITVVAGSAVIEEVIREVRLTLTEEGAIVRPVVGTPRTQEAESLELEMLR